MSIRLMELVFQSDSLRDPVDSLLLLRLAFFVNDRVDPERCFCRMKELAQAARLCVRQAGRHLDRLERDGWIRANRKGGRGRAPDFWMNRAKLEAESKPQNSDTQDVADSSLTNRDTQDVDVSGENCDSHDVAVSNKNCDISAAIPRHSEPETATFQPETATPRMSPHREIQLKKPTETSFSQASPEIEKDSRHVPFRDYYLGWFQNVNGISDKWGAREGATLNRFLSDYPDVTLGQLRTILRHRQLSPVTKTQPFADWFSRAACWQSGPCDPFGNPPREGYTDRNVRVSRAIAQRHAIDGPRRVNGLDALNKLFPAVLEGERAVNGRAGLPAPVGASSGREAGRNGHPRLTAAPAPSADILVGGDNT